LVIPLIYNDIDQWIHSIIGDSKPKVEEEKKDEREIDVVKAQKGMLGIVVCGPSGVGKGTMLGKLKERFPNKFSSTVSHTTRQPRPGEVEGRDYFFVSTEKFESMLKANEFFEVAKVHDHYYGTSNDILVQISSRKQIILVEVDVHGANQIRKKPGLGENAKYLFITMPGGVDELKQRLKGRGTEKEEDVEKRMKTAVKELEFLEQNPKFFDKVVVNDDLDRSCKELYDTLLEWYPSLRS